MPARQDNRITVAPWFLRVALLGLLGLLANAAPAQAPEGQRQRISGAGATFPAPVYEAWAAAYPNAASVDFHYSAVGSGLGVARIRHGEVDFGASDAPLSSQELEAAGLLQFPAVIGGVLPVINISGIRPGELKLTGAVLARIYLGTVRRWNDPAIAALNPDLHLPGTNITVVHRSEPSGSSLLWTTYLAGADPDWKSRVGASLSPSWPAGVGAAGNEGVASYVQRTRYAIGYVEYYFARSHNLSDVALRNRDGRIVRARPDNFLSAVAADQGVLLADQQLPQDAPGESSWPITGASFVLVANHPADPARTRAVLRLFDWSLQHGAQVAEQLEYTPLPPALVDRVREMWHSVEDITGKPVWP